MREMNLVFIEDQTLVRHLLTLAAAELLPEAKVYGAASKATGLEICREHPPNLVILDLVLPDGEGILLVPEIREIAPATKIIGLSSYVDDYTLHRLFETKVDGFIDKNEQGLEVFKKAILTVMGGENYFSPTAHRIWLKLKTDPLSFTKVLSNREMELMILFGAGLSDEEVSRETSIKANTVRNHRQNIMGKLNLNSTRRLIRYAIENGFAR